jgi:hypothetical protein
VNGDLLQRTHEIVKVKLGHVQSVMQSPIINTSILLSTYEYTHSLMELSSSREAANCAATQELPSILWNPEVHYRVHKSPPLLPIRSQIDPVHTIPSYLSKIYFNRPDPRLLVIFETSLFFTVRSC